MLICLITYLIIMPFVMLGILVYVNDYEYNGTTSEKSRLVFGYGIFWPMACSAYLFLLAKFMVVECKKIIEKDI